MVCKGLSGVEEGAAPRQPRSQGFSLEGGAHLKPSREKPWERGWLPEKVGESFEKRFAHPQAIHNQNLRFSYYI